MKNVFEVRNLKFKYRNVDIDTIKSISFDVPEGKIFGLLGPSGAGKSTTQKILIKLLSNYEGQIFYLGKDLKTYGSSFYEDIGVGFEMPVHFNKLTALENLKYFASLYQNNADVYELLKKVKLYEAKDQLVGEFSKGMKVRLNFIRALINKPKILFLDEPTNGLDPTNAKIIKDMIIDFKNKGGSVVITTHLMSDVEQLCDEVVFMKDGKITEKSSPRDLKIKYGKKEVYLEYLENNITKKQIFNINELAHNQQFFNIINNYSIEMIHSGETSLEEIFIKVTGEQNE